jgi:hypothetical protein
MKSIFNFLIFYILMGTICTSCSNVPGSGTKSSPSGSYKMTTPIPDGIEIPARVDSRLGTLKFFDGFPDDATVDKLYDNLDFQRAVQAYLLGIPSVSMISMRNALICITDRWFWRCLPGYWGWSMIYGTALWWI